MNREEALGKDSIGRLIFRYSLPSILSMLVTSLYSIADRAFIGAIPEVGTIAISGLGITMPIFNLIVAFGVLIGAGTATNMAIKLGEGDKDIGEAILGNALTLSVIFSIIVTIFGLLFIDKILFAFGASNQTLFYAKEYIVVIILGTIFNVTAFVLNTAIRAEGNPKLAGKTMIVGCILNLILDPIFIFTFKMGIRGAAIATVICQFVIFVWVLVYFIKSKSNLKLRKKNLYLHWNLVKGILIIGSAPFAVEIAASMVEVVNNNMFKAYGGDLAIGAMTTISSIALIFMRPVFGINQGIQTIIGYNYGAKKLDRCKKTLSLSILISTIILTCGFLIIQISPELLIGIFTDDKELIDIAVSGMRIYLSTLPLLGIAIVGPSFFQAIGKPKQSMLLSLLRQMILLVPLILIIPRYFGIRGIWMAQPIADILCSIIISIFLMKEFKGYMVTEVVVD